MNSDRPSFGVSTTRWKWLLISTPAWTDHRQSNIGGNSPGAGEIFSKQDGKSRVVVKATGNWMYLYETIRSMYPM
jgi:hypothetical protein